jgi:hypothetical protein
MPRLLRTIRFDESDGHVFAEAAGSGEIAVSGAFVFANPADLKGKARQAFVSGFLSVESLGWSTFATVATVDDEVFAQLVETLAEQCVARLGAPDLAAARPVAEAELAFVRDLCADAPVNTVFAVRREVDESGEVREAFRAVSPPRAATHTRIWDVVPE